jgi:hypothetical protein
VQLLGYQDTLLANTGNQLYAKSLITGAVDFIFGQTATAWFENVDIRTIASGCITASGRAPASNPSWYMINKLQRGQYQRFNPSWGELPWTPVV